MAATTRCALSAARDALAAPSDDARQLRLEGLAREIDAAFDRDALTPELADLRSQIVSALGE